MTGGETLFAILSGLAINECCEISPWAARKLVHWSARRCYVDPVRAEVRAEELAALIDDRPGKLFKLITALGFVTGAIMSAVRRAVARNAPRIADLTKKLVRRGRAPLAPLLTGRAVVLLDTSTHGVRAYDARRANGFVNDLECDWVLAACRRINAEQRRRPGPPATVSVLTYYGAQAHALRRLLDTHYADFPGIRFQIVGTLGEAQGQQSEFAIVSFCRASRSGRVIGFLNDVRRLHVARTRASRGLIMVGHAPTLRQIRGPAAGVINQLLDSAMILHDLRELEA
ncbi:C-terminal helicase domain-containing protein [Actinomadura napierensis]|uniref:DNA2/NAM7 helicase-like C-terminal domain-containing protein n=1 Tax=Actinomadura napierensis TaxID=267854 RepID=A0ABN2YM16_9ACTN